MAAKDVCANCKWFLPNLYKQFMHRISPLEKCGIDAFGRGSTPKIDMLKEISWNPQRKGCDEHELFVVERQESNSAIH